MNTRQNHQIALFTECNVQDYKVENEECARLLVHLLICLCFV